MLTASLVLGLTLVPGAFLERMGRTPPPMPAALAGKPPIEVGVGPLPPGVGGPADLDVLKAARLPHRGDALLAFFRKRTPPAPPRGKMEGVVAQLGAADGDAAADELLAIGMPAAPLLREVINHAEDPDAARRARFVMSYLDGDAAAALVTHAARGLAATKPAGAAEALLDYLPFAEDTASYQEMQAALQAVAQRDGVIDPALIDALRDRNAVRRGTAARVVSTAGGAAVYATVRPLLKDPKASVRLGVALSLVGAYDAEAVPVLIDLLAELPASLRPAAEDYLTTLAGEWAVAGPRGHDGMSARLRRNVWDAWWRSVDGSLLVEEFRSRTPSDDDREKIDALIARLPDDLTAQEALMAFGKKASGQLRRAVNSGGPKVQPAAQKCLEAIEKGEPNPLPQAAARLLALRRPEGTVEALLGYIAVSETDDATAQLIDILVTVACPGGKPAEAVVSALADRSPARRAAAAQAICRAKAAGPAVRKLLEDKDAVVRLRAATALAQGGEKVAVPVLIDTLTDLPLELVWEAEDLLCRLAGEHAPAESAGEDRASREKAVAAWQAWYRAHGTTLDLTKVDLSGGSSGQLIVVEQWNRTKGGRGRVLEMDPAGKVRWEIEGLDYPWDAQVLRNGNVLLIEQQNRVTERDRKGKVVWDKYFTSPFVLERLPNGHTWLGCRNNLMVVDKDGKTVFNHVYNTNTILGARRFRDGSMAYVAYSGEYVRLDRNGKQVKTFTLPISSYSLTGAEIAAGDRVLISTNSLNKVIEYGPDGKEAWSASVANPTPPTRLANGNTLVASNGLMALYEIDRKGKVVKEWKGLTHNPFRAFRR